MFKEPQLTLIKAIFLEGKSTTLKENPLET